MDSFKQIKNVITSLIVLATLLSAQSSTEYSEGEELLEKLRSFDQAFLHRQTLVMETVGLAHYRDPSQGQKKTKVTLTADGSAMAVEREISYMSEPSYRKKTKFTQIDYDMYDNLIVWRFTRTRNLLESDFQASQIESMCVRVSPDGQITKDDGAPFVQFHQPSNWRCFWDFRRPLWATGRGFADCLTKITEINQEQGGMISFSASGSLGPGTEGTWQMRVEPKAAYLVRSASYTPTGRDSPDFVCTTTGTKWFKTLCLAEQANLTISPPKLLPNNIMTTKTKQFQPEPAMWLFDRLRGMLRGPLPKNTEVFDFRANPEKPLRYRIGELPMTDRKPPDAGDVVGVNYPRLVNKPLSDMKELGNDPDPNQTKNKMILACFFDMQQRPSRNCILQLSKQAEKLKREGLAIVVVHASKVDGNTLNEWVKKNNLPFPVGMVQSDEEKTRLAWGVKSLPWLVLTDSRHIVRAEGFALAELDEIRELATKILEDKTAVDNLMSAVDKAVEKRVEELGWTPEFPDNSPPKESPGQDISVSSEATRLFEEEVQRAEKASERDEKIEHFRNALKHRPGHPDNLAAEFRIAVLLSQYYSPKNPQPVRRRDSVAVYENILRTYEHMDYYSKDPVISSSDMQFMIPQAAIHLACLYRGLDRDNSKARQWTHFAMECMQKTCEQRTKDWANEPAPPEVREDDPFGGPRERAKWKSRMHMWEQRQKRAKEGDVFSPLEMATVKAAVRQYGYSFGLRQKAGDVALAMGNILRDFPGTPMTKIAEGHIGRAKEMQLEELNRSVMDEFSENISRDSEPLDELTKSESDSFESKEIFIPNAGIALTKKKPFVLDLLSSKLLDPDAEADSKQACENLLKLGKGDIAWDGSLITVRKAKALTIPDESHHPLKCTPGRWCNWNELPDKVDLPYSLLVVTNEDIDYLITIRKIETDGIRITYKKLMPDEAKRYLQTRNEKK